MGFWGGRRWRGQDAAHDADAGRVRRDWVGLVFFVSPAALGWLLAGRAPGATTDGWLAQYIHVRAACFVSGHSGAGHSYSGLRIQLTAGGWGWRGLADGSCCEGVA